MDLKRSCPAVSQMASLIFLSSRSTFLIRKSIPIVLSRSSNLCSQYCCSNELLPTPLSPNKMNLRFKSKSSVGLVVISQKKKGGKEQTRETIRVSFDRKKRKKRKRKEKESEIKMIEM